MPELKVNRNKAPHVHVIRKMKDLVTGHEDENHTTLSSRHRTFSIETTLDDMIRSFQFTEYVKNYSFYKDGATEYIRFEGTLLGYQLKLTMDVFTCYCQPLNENQEPPF